MNGDELMNIICSAEFRMGLEEISSYLESIKQEGPIVHLLAKCLWRNKHTFALERNERRDLTIWTPALHSGTTETCVEFKFHYDCDMQKLRKELEKNGDQSLKQTWLASRALKRSIGWGVQLNIYQDVIEKNPDIFIWIICSRDLSKVDSQRQNRICWSKEQCKYNDKFKYSNRGFLEVADAFLEKLQAVRKFSVLPVEFQTFGDFPSTYHFRICEFRKTS